VPGNQATFTAVEELIKLAADAGWQSPVLADVTARRRPLAARSAR
jgi:hypothetical protein